MNQFDTTVPPFTEDALLECAARVIDPELNINIVDLGLVYKVSSSYEQRGDHFEPHVYVIMTLTTPGCPLAAVFDTMVRESFIGLPGLDLENVHIELTFDPPWVPDLMSESAKAELGFD